jgi:hypothetical protein
VNNEHTYNAITGRLAKLRDSLGEKTPPIVPASEIIARASRRRVRRLVSGTVGVLALAAVAAVAVTALLPASHPVSSQPSQPAHAQLAAWTVSRKADGTVIVTIREFRDPAGLQRKLRADGIPASIIFAQDLVVHGNQVVHIRTYPCQIFNGGNWSTAQLARAAHLVDPRAADPFRDGLVINPSALPAHAGIQFFISRSFVSYTPQHHGGMGFLEGLVQATRACTGS